MNKTRSAYFPAFSHAWITCGRELLVKWFIRETAVNNRLVEQGRVEKVQRVLDLGCGTASLLRAKKPR